jgi:serine/threonine protein phosphatase 1
MKLFVVSDIHGHYTALKEALDGAGFDRHNEEHQLVCCGDYFDRGRENLEVLKFFEGVKRKVLLRGNHEDMLLKLLRTGRLLPHHYINGTFTTLQSIFGEQYAEPLGDTVDFSEKTEIVDRFCAFISESLDYYETAHYVFVHGWLPEQGGAEKALGGISPDAWERARCLKWTTQYQGTRPLPDKTLICGHVPTFFAQEFQPHRDPNDSTIFYGDGLIAIDAGTTDTKRINVLVLEEE